MRLLFAIVLGILALMLAALLLFVYPAWGATCCTTYEEKTLGRLQTVCSDGTRAIHTWNHALSRWESTVTVPPIHRDQWPKAPRR
jgi:hypothetical protein